MSQSMKKQKLKAISPAKLILAGEHAVLYGHPAIAVAVDRYAESCISNQILPTIIFNFLNLDYAKSFTLQALTLLKHRLREQYHAFLHGQCNIREVLKMPFELLQFAVSNLLEKLNIELPHGLEIHTSSNIPMGCGMGSSAATVMSTLFALAHFLKLDLDPNRFLTLGKEAENLQHGRSSGIDLQLALQGGCIKFKEGKTEKKSPLQIPLSIVHTGTPLTTTGQCVAFTEPFFREGGLGDDFGSVAESLALALSEQAQSNQDSTRNFTEIKRCVRENHQLLLRVGVVPDKVAAFIQSVEKLGGAAKICGAGAIAGENAGIVWIVGDEELKNSDEMQMLLQSYGYQMQVVQSDNHGTRIV